MSLPLYHKKNKFVSGFLLLTNLLYEEEEHGRSKESEYREFQEKDR